MPSLGGGGTYGGSDITGGASSSSSAFGGSNGDDDNVTTGSLATGLGDFVTEGKKQMEDDPGGTRDIEQAIVDAVLGDKSDEETAALIKTFNEAEETKDIGGILGTLTGLKSKSAINEEGIVDDYYTKTVSPIAIAGGLFGGLPGMIAGAIYSDKDPFAFDIDIGFVDAFTPSPGDKPKREGDTTHAERKAARDAEKKGKDRDGDGKKKKTPKKPKDKTPTKDFKKKTDKALVKTFTFADMPEFDILSDKFGTLGKRRKKKGTK